MVCSATAGKPNFWVTCATDCHGSRFFLCTSHHVPGCPRPHSASGCYQRPCRRGSLHRHSSPCWKSLPRLSQPGVGIGSAAIQDWRHWTELGLLECSWRSWVVWAVYSVIPNLNRAPHWKSLALARNLRTPRGGKDGERSKQQRVERVSYRLLHPSTKQCVKPWDWRGMLWIGHMSTFKEPFMSGWHSMGPFEFASKSNDVQCDSDHHCDWSCLQSSFKKRE